MQWMNVKINQDFFEKISESIAKNSALDIRHFFLDTEEIDTLKSKVIEENRNAKIENIIEDKPFKETKLEDFPEYQEIISKGVSYQSIRPSK